MKEITLKIPDNIDIEVNELSMIVAAKLYETGKLSLGQAAEIAGLTKRTFAELLGKYNVSIFNYSKEELIEELENV
jgi:predicted HTH domain antitoxin